MLNDFKRSIKMKDVEGNRIYLYITYKGCKYGQSYQNQSNTKEGMLNDFAVFYYPLVEKSEINYIYEQMESDRIDAEIDNQIKEEELQHLS